MAKYTLTILCKFSTVYQRIMGYLLLFTGFGNFLLKHSSWCTKIIHDSLDSVFTRAEPQEQREPLYGTCRLHVTGFRLLVMPFKMLHTFVNYWHLTVGTERVLVWETENTAYKIIISANFEVFFSSFVLWKYLDMETPGPRKKISGAIEAWCQHFLLSLSSLYIAHTSQIGGQRTILFKTVLAYTFFLFLRWIFST